MSRIEEALRRTGDVAAQAGDDQQPFKPAWQTPKGEEPSGIVPADSPSRQFAPKITSDAGTVSLSERWQERLASGSEGDPGLIEQFRRLAATLHHAQQNSGLRSVMVTSAMPGDGKTLTTVNLALVLGESYRYNVLLVDADLRRPSIPNATAIGEGSGLSDALRSQTEQKLALVQLTPRVTLLPAGKPVANSIEALTSPRMRLILEEATARFDWVILDAPPVGPATDARLLSQMVGGTLLVVHAGKSQHPDVQRAIDAVGRDQLLGVVLNGVHGRTGDGYYGLDRSEQD